MLPVNYTKCIALLAQGQFSHVMLDVSDVRLKVQVDKPAQADRSEQRTLVGVAREVAFVFVLLFAWTVGHVTSHVSR